MRLPTRSPIWKGSASAPESELAYQDRHRVHGNVAGADNLESNTSYWAKVKAVGSLDSDWSETANATTMDSGGEPLLPTADLLDVVFRNDGSAMDNSPSATPVRALEGTAMMTYYNDLYSRYAAHFNHTPGTSVNDGSTRPTTRPTSSSRMRSPTGTRSRRSSSWMRSRTVRPS